LGRLSVFSLAYLQTQEAGAESLISIIFFTRLAAMTPDARPASTWFHSSEDPTQNNKAALDELMPLVYTHLRRMAAVFLQRERQGHTLQPTALANEAYLRFVAQRNVDWQDPAQILGLATQMMRRILINYAEAHKAAKRGPVPKISLDEAIHSPNAPEPDILALNDALSSLAIIDPVKGRIVELRFFGGLTMQEISTIVGKSLASVEREWSLARAWLYREIHHR
jgi:RNA polymerase sigma factor (TIGR02999 family)